jgi:hypothetical protein
MTAQHREFELTNKDGDPIRGDVWTSEGGRRGAAIVICHGFKGFKNWGFFPYTAEQLLERTGRPVVQFNFSGCGIGPDLENFTELDKFERNTFSKELADVRIVLDAAELGTLPGLAASRRSSRRRRIGASAPSSPGTRSLMSVAGPTPRERSGVATSAWRSSTPARVR